MSAHKVQKQQKQHKPFCNCLQAQQEPKQEEQNQQANKTQPQSVKKQQLNKKQVPDKKQVINKKDPQNDKKGSSVLKRQNALNDMEYKKELDKIIKQKGQNKESIKNQKGKPNQIKERHKMAIDYREELLFKEIQKEVAKDDERERLLEQIQTTFDKEEPSRQEVWSQSITMPRFQLSLNIS